MSDFMKAMIGFVILMAAGFIIVGTSEQSEEEKLNAAFVRTANLLFKYANEKCTAAVRERTGTMVYEPTETSSDKQSYATLIWRSDKGDFKEAKCTFKQDLGGISELVIDGNTIVSR
ncbi:MAG: hypothetical protein ABFS02_13475 [Pseudomonadota bacterium]